MVSIWRLDKPLLVGAAAELACSQAFWLCLLPCMRVRLPPHDWQRAADKWMVSGSTEAVPAVHPCGCCVEESRP